MVPALSRLAKDAAIEARSGCLRVKVGLRIRVRVWLRVRVRVRVRVRA